MVESEQSPKKLHSLVKLGCISGFIIFWTLIGIIIILVSDAGLFKSALISGNSKGVTSNQV